MSKDINKTNNDGNTPLLLALQNDVDSSIIKLLIKNRADVKAKNNKGETPLLLAMNNYNKNFPYHELSPRTKDREKVVKLLIENDKNFNITDYKFYENSDVGGIILKANEEKMKKLSGNNNMNNNNNNNNMNKY
jgi:ankyrin repeat protein